MYCKQWRASFKNRTISISVEEFNWKEVEIWFWQNDWFKINKINDKNNDWFDLFLFLKVQIIFVDWLRHETCSNVVSDHSFDWNASRKSHSGTVCHRCVFACELPNYVYCKKWILCKDGIHNGVCCNVFHEPSLRPSMKIHGNRLGSGTETLWHELKHVSSNFLRL